MALKAYKHLTDGEVKIVRKAQQRRRRCWPTR
jgi:hypothetical protein